MVLHEGAVAEMRTGEGKTLTATLAAYLNALPGGGVHIVTVNDYLAARDAERCGARGGWGARLPACCCCLLALCAAVRPAPTPPRLCAHPPALPHPTTPRPRAAWASCTASWA
jgi:hypothetical protein